MCMLAIAASCGGGTDVRRNAKLSNTHYLIAQDYLKKKNADAAKEELIKAIKYDSSNHEAQHLIGVVFFLEGVHAMNYLDRKQCLTGRAANEQREAANVQFRMAEDYLNKAVKLLEKKKKTESDGLNYLANIALHFSRYDQAVAYATRATNNVIYGNRHMALGTRGWAHFKSGNNNKAARDLRQALFHQPRFCVGRFRLAKVYYARGDHQKVVAELKKVVNDKACTFQDPHHLLGLAYTKLRMPDKARTEFDRCVALNPRSCLAGECRRYAKLIGQ